jgi:hypothetical protein
LLARPGSPRWSHGRSPSSGVAACPTFRHLSREERLCLALRARGLLRRTD